MSNAPLPLYGLRSAQSIKAATQINEIIASEVGNSLIFNSKNLHQQKYLPYLPTKKWRKLVIFGVDIGVEFTHLSPLRTKCSGYAENRPWDVTEKCGLFRGPFFGLFFRGLKRMLNWKCRASKEKQGWWIGTGSWMESFAKDLRRKHINKHGCLNGERLLCKIVNSCYITLLFQLEKSYHISWRRDMCTYYSPFLIIH